MKEKEMKKQLERYASDRIREKRYFADILRRLEAELRDNQIEPHIYERLRANLEKQFHQKQEREWERLGSKIDNLLNS